MISIIEYLKKFPIIKKVGRKVLKLKECYFRLIAEDAFFKEYAKHFLELPDTRDNYEESLEDQYVKGNLRIISQPLVTYYDELWKTIEKKIADKESYIIMRVGDGEANFLRGIIRGNTAKRHLTNGKVPTKEYLELFKKNLLACDSIHVQMYKGDFKAFQSIYKRNIFSDIPLECIYGLVASRKIFNNDYKIGIIGSDKKITIIKKLLEHKEYCTYIGRDQFEDYISIPERGSTNDVEALFKEISAQLKPKVDIYIVGIGIAKMAVLSRFKEVTNSVFIDVGCGISALAGLTSNGRPYFGDWVNFRLKDFDYNAIDVMDADMSEEGKQYL